MYLPVLVNKYESTFLTLKSVTYMYIRLSKYYYDEQILQYQRLWRHITGDYQAVT